MFSHVAAARAPAHLWGTAAAKSWDVVAPHVLFALYPSTAPPSEAQPIKEPKHIGSSHGSHAVRRGRRTRRAS